MNQPASPTTSRGYSAADDLVRRRIGQRVKQINTSLSLMNLLFAFHIITQEKRKGIKGKRNANKKEYFEEEYGTCLYICNYRCEKRVRLGDHVVRREKSVNGNFQKKDLTLSEYLKSLPVMDGCKY